MDTHQVSFGIHGNRVIPDVLNLTAIQICTSVSICVVRNLEKCHEFNRNVTKPVGKLRKYYSYNINTTFFFKLLLLEGYFINIFIPDGAFSKIFAFKVK